jgi:hypothetical protein
MQAQQAALPASPGSAATREPAVSATSGCCEGRGDGEQEVGRGGAGGEECCHEEARLDSDADVSVEAASTELDRLLDTLETQWQDSALLVRQRKDAVREAVGAAAALEKTVKELQLQEKGVNLRLSACLNNSEEYHLLPSLSLEFLSLCEKRKSAEVAAEKAKRELNTHLDLAAAAGDKLEVCQQLYCSVCCCVLQNTSE